MVLLSLFVGSYRVTGIALLLFLDIPFILGVFYYVIFFRMHKYDL